MRSLRFTARHGTSRPDPRGLEIRRSPRVDEGPDRSHTVRPGAGNRGGVSGIDTADGNHRQAGSYGLSKPLQALGRAVAPLFRRVENGAEQGVVGSGLRGGCKFFQTMRGDSQQQTSLAHARAHLPPRRVGWQVNAIGIAGHGGLEVAVHDQDAVEGASEGAAEVDQIGPSQVLLAQLDRRARGEGSGPASEATGATAELPGADRKQR